MTKLIFVSILSLLVINACSAAQYTLKDKNNKICIIFNSTLGFSYSYIDDKNATKEATWNVQEASAITGSCDSKVAKLQLNFTKPLAAQFTMTMVDNSGIVQLSDVSLLINIQKGEVFKNPKSIGQQSLISSKPNINLSPDSKYFDCNSRLLVGITDKASVTLVNTKLQAFGIVNDQLGTEASPCLADVEINSETSNATDTTESPDTTTAGTDEPTTSSPMTTTSSPMTTTTALPMPPLLNISISGSSGVCLVAQLRTALLIKYPTRNASRTANFWLPTTATIKGSCGAKEQIVGIYFNDDWYLRFIFTGSAGKDYNLASVSFSYTLDPQRFPDVATPGMSLSTQLNRTFVKVSANNYYTCNSKLTFKLNSAVTMETTDLMVQAFRSRNDTQFSGEAVKCDLDLPTDNIVPIIVGSALAGLVLIVLVAYIIGRRRSTGSGYQSV